jgi:uncharacterized membrane protein YeaQ/YmgE (transglycosylase-associated protein family)
MSILVWIVFGLVVGLIARAIFPGRQSMGVITTMLLGIAGSLLGGVIGNMLVGVDPMNGANRFDLTGAGFIGSLLGALAILAIIGMIKRPTTLGADRTTAH